MDEKMTMYKVFRTILGPIYRLWYNPKIIGRENIPKEGSIVVVGNHIHIMDQCNIVVVTKRNLHYMAKKEYFDGKMAWFFRSSGCISVDRSKKDEEATKEALEVLSNNHALGLFPEGTRNGLKEERIKELYEKYLMENKIEYNDFVKKMKKNKTSHVNYLESLLEEKLITREEFLDNIYDMNEFLKDLVLNHRITLDEYLEKSLLPFKFGAVSMAHKTNSYIVPFAITGDYKFRSKNLTIRIGEAFSPSDDLEATNELLREKIKELMKENYKNSGK
ncbi:MAG: 1-acyl-sn-glycerol-3-phosphate acyltransferase [Bacilli bacterium]|nr:1-acyl-sn-glycerol-3-phosphate acyltransferase [Bacilli bacterium]